MCQSKQTVAFQGKNCVIRKVIYHLKVYLVCPLDVSSILTSQLLVPSVSWKIGAILVYSPVSWHPYKHRIMKRKIRKQENQFYTLDKEIRASMLKSVIKINIKGQFRRCQINMTACSEDDVDDNDDAETRYTTPFLTQ